MKKRAAVNFLWAGILCFLFLLLTVLLKFVDVQPIGPLGSSIGLATINGGIFESVGINPIWDKISDVFMILSLACAGAFGCLGVWQWISRKSLKKVDLDLFFLAGFYVSLGVVYVLFEEIVLNYRPILEDGELVASYPSSHTVLVCGIMLTTAFQLRKRIKSKPLSIVLAVTCCAVVLLTAVARILAGVHWYTDVMGAILLAGALAFAYFGVVFQWGKKKR